MDRGPSVRRQPLQVLLGTAAACPSRHWLGDTAPELFREYLHPGRARRAVLLRDQIAALHARSSALFSARRGRQLVAIAGIYRQEWDSAHFGFGCARIGPLCVSSAWAGDEASYQALLERCIEWAHGAGVRMLTRRLLARRVAELRVLERLGFRLVDSVVTMIALPAEIERATRRGPDLPVRPASAGDRAALAGMTDGAFSHSRFVADPRIPSPLGRSLYVRWIENLLDRALARSPDRKLRILVAEADGLPCGYVVLSRDSTPALGRKLAKVELIVVDRGFRGRGVGNRLLRAAAEAASALGANLIESSTWTAHRMAVRSNQNAGFRLCENLLAFHRHR